jgi:hypothetical protein
MKIDWTGLVMVAGVSITMAVAFVVLLAFGIRLVSAANVPDQSARAGRVDQAAGYALLGLAAGLVLLGLYLIIPQFH